MSELRTNKIYPRDGLPAGASGGIVQIVQANNSTQVNVTANTYTDTGLTATITPTSASNKIMVWVYTGQVYKSAADTQADFQIVRGSTDIYFFSCCNTNGATADTSNMTVNYLDSPATTSAVTYKLTFKNRDASGTVASNQNGTQLMTLMEVSG